MKPKVSEGLSKDTVEPTTYTLRITLYGAQANILQNSQHFGYPDGQAIIRSALEDKIKKEDWPANGFPVETKKKEAKK